MKQTSDNFLAGIVIGAIVIALIWYAVAHQPCDSEMPWVMWLQCVNQ